MQKDAKRFADKVIATQRCCAKILQLVLKNLRKFLK